MGASSSTAAGCDGRPDRRGLMCARVSVAALALFVAALAAPKEVEYARAKTCGGCHAELFAVQSASEHAHALHPSREHPLAGRFAASGATLRIPNAQWAFGAGDQAVTFVSQLNEDTYLEHHFSYYSATRSLLPTPGHKGVPPSGVLYPTFDPKSRIMRCFQCHSTGPLTLGPKFDIVPTEAGVRCESCHGPGRRHVEAARHGDRAAGNFIQNPRRLSPVELNNFCGACHRQPAPAGAATNWTDPWNVRHQPLYLDQSACFQKSRGTLSCLTCHDPHTPLEKKASYYNGRCAGCHADKPHAQTARLRGEDCIGCHMPRVAPQEHLAFTNHWIGIYKAGSALRPLP